MDQERIIYIFDYLSRYTDENKAVNGLIANGVSMKAIQEWLGHSTFNVTANFYSHLDFRSKEQSAETIAKVLGGESTKPEMDKQDKENGDEKNRKSS